MMSENVESGRVRNFSKTCSLLSQYLKENKGSTLADLNNSIGCGGASTTKTMDLFPQKSPFKINNSASSVNKSEPEASQMTIFYGGKVIVFNDFPADKAKELMLLASNVSNTTSSTPLNQVQKPLEPTTLVPLTNSTNAPNICNNLIQDHAQGPTKPTVTDLPIMRKASLTRFLEKRKDRITARAPYAVPAETKSWLGLAAEGAGQVERQL